MNKELLIKAYHEWSDFIKELSDDDKKGMESIIEPIKLNNLHYYVSVANHQLFDQTVNQLSEKYLFDEEIILTVFNNYLSRNLHEQSYDYLMKAIKYYEYNNLTIPQIIEDLRTEYPDEEMVKKLRLILGNLPSQRVDDIPRILPPNLNGQIKLNNFILYEIIQASKVLLEKIEAVSDIRTENKYNDLLLAILRLRLPIWGWTIEDQSRVGSASGGRDAGEADFIIKSSGNSIALLEAFILRDKTYTEKHILKCKDYISNLDRYYIIIYYKKDSKKFLKYWEDYKRDILNIKYPQDFNIDLQIGIKELSNEIKDLNNIKVSKTIHQDIIEMYHIMINLGI